MTKGTPEVLWALGWECGGGPEARVAAVRGMRRREKITKVHQKTLGVMDRFTIMIVEMLLQCLPMLKLNKLYTSNTCIYYVSVIP